jgi:nucleoside-diphosphate-sugar epimerase
LTPRTVAVTGATGFVGQAVCRALDSAGHRVVTLGRRSVDTREHRAYDLAQPVASDMLHGVDSLVHCAYDLSLTNSDAIAAINVRGCENLALAAERSAVKGILISSMSAYPGTRQIYGRAKLSSESTFLQTGGEAVRLGLVWGGAEGGMIGTLKRLSGLPVVPRLAAGSRLFTVHVDDMAAGIVNLLESPRLGEPLGLANPVSVPFEDIIRDLRGRQAVFLPLSWRPVHASMQIAERLGIPLPIRADSLLGLVRPAGHVPNAGVWQQLGVFLRAWGT